jgi:hypothetical protein
LRLTPLFFELTGMNKNGAKMKRATGAKVDELELLRAKGVLADSCERLGFSGSATRLRTSALSDLLDHDLIAIDAMIRFAATSTIR